METTASSSGGGSKAAVADGGGKPSASAWTKRRRREAGQSPRKKEGGGKNKVATAANDATWDEEEEALGALIYKFSRTARAREKRRRSSAAPLGDELQPSTRKRLRKAGKEGASLPTAAVGAEISPDRDTAPTTGHGFKPNDEQWAKRYDQLQEYKKRHGHCNIPRSYIVDGIKLGRWVSKQRQYYKEGKLSDKRRDRLDGIGFQWAAKKNSFKVDDGKWNERFRQLKAYKEEHGNCNVPQRFVANEFNLGSYAPAKYDLDGFKLGKWVVNQRHRCKNGKVSSERIQLLGEIGFRF